MIWGSNAMGTSVAATSFVFDKTDRRSPRVTPVHSSVTRTTACVKRLSSFSGVPFLTAASKTATCNKLAIHRNAILEA